LDRNFLLAFALSLLVITLWMSIQPAPQQSEGSPAGPEQGQPARREAGEGEGVGSAPGAIPDWEPAAPGEQETPFGEAQAPTGPSPSAEPVAGRTVTVSTDLFDAGLSSVGGTLSRFDLRTYHDESGEQERPVSLAASALGVPGALATPFGELGLGNWGTAAFDVDQPDRHTVVFSRSFGGVTLRKTYLFEEGRYDFRMRLELTNGTPRVLEPIYEAVWPAVKQDTSDFAEFSLVALQEDDVEQLMLASSAGTGCGGFGGAGDESKTLAGNVYWAGAQTRYFLAALIPEVAKVSSARFLPLEPGKIAVTTVGQNKIQLGPGASHSYEYRVYVGPKEPERLAASEFTAVRLDAAIQLGWSWVAPLARFFSWLLVEMYQYIPNYGWVIILVTILVRVVTAPLLGRQMRSMKKMSAQMQALKPRLDAIKETHGDDRQKMSEETMKAYREAGVNPLGMLGGCLPLLLQFPVFIGLFYALQSSIELRQAPFFAWITDLSVPETLFVIPGLDLPLRVLPLIMGASMFLQQKLTPQTSMDPAQAQMMTTVMPVMFTLLFYQFPSGLVLYWMVSNFLAIAHQLWINRAPA
jgi:YidC/Oxa1 family membrane protein insertase